MGFVSGDNEIYLVGYLTQLGRKKFISNQFGINPIVQFTLSDTDINYGIANNLNSNQEFNIPDSGFIPNLTGNIDFCFPVISKGIDNSYTNNFLVANYLYSESASYTAYCDVDRVGNSITSTFTSTGKTKTDAYNNAYNLAKNDAMSKLVCGWQSTQTATAQCQPGFTGVTTNGSGTYISYVSLDDAISNALKLAQQDAMSKLICNPVDKKPIYVATSDYRCKGSNSPLNGTPSTLNVGNVVQRRYTNTNPNIIVADQWRDEGTNVISCPLPIPPVQIYKVKQGIENVVVTNTANQGSQYTSTTQSDVYAYILDSSDNPAVNPNINISYYTKVYQNGVLVDGNTILITNSNGQNKVKIGGNILVKVGPNQYSLQELTKIETQIQAGTGYVLS